MTCPSTLKFPHPHQLPLLVPPPNPGPEPAQPCRGGANGGPWGPCVPGAKRDRQQIVSLSYTLASEASQRSKLITGNRLSL